MCAGDTTLEAVDEKEGGTDGWGTVHQCRDFKSIWKMAEGRRWGDEGGVL